MNFSRERKLAQTEVGATESNIFWKHPGRLADWNWCGKSRAHLLRAYKNQWTEMGYWTCFFAYKNACHVHLDQKALVPCEHQICGTCPYKCKGQEANCPSGRKRIEYILSLETEDGKERRASGEHGIIVVRRWSFVWMLRISILYRATERLLDLRFIHIRAGSSG